MSSPLKQNTTTIQNLLNIINSLPEAGTDLPELTNEGSASDLLSGKQLIDQDGNIVTGTIATKTSSDLTASGATVTVPAGYYASNATKSVATATRADTTMSVIADDTNDKITITASNNQSTGYVTGSNKTASKTISLTASGATVTASDGSSSISKSVATATQATPSITVDSAGKITASATQTAGYVAAGTKTGTKQLTTQATKTVTPTKSSQTAVAKDVYTTGVVTVAAIPSTYVKPTATKSATTYTPTTSNQTIAAGTYCSGVQTIKGDANLKAENIAEGVSIFGVTGTHSGGSGSGGGADIKTCTVTITTDGYMTLLGVAATTFENNSVSSMIAGNSITIITTPFVIENVINGSSLYVHTKSYDMTGVTTNGATIVSYAYAEGSLYFKIDENATNVTIHIYDDD